MAVDAKITQIQSKSAKYNADGELTSEPYASITLNVPLDSDAQTEGVYDVLTLLRTEWVVLDISTKQNRMFKQPPTEKQLEGNEALLGQQQ